MYANAHVSDAMFRKLLGVSFGWGELLTTPEPETAARMRRCARRWWHTDPSLRSG